MLLLLLLLLRVGACRYHQVPNASDTCCPPAPLSNRIKANHTDMGLMIA
jgi:hypothetical protein